MATILMYHHIGVPRADDPERNLYVSPEAFGAQLDFLARGGRDVVSLDTVREGLLGERRLSARSVAITFDDGYKNNFDLALPELKRRGVTATFFITTGWIGRGRNGDRPADSGEAPCMTEEELRGMREAGMTIGSHTVSHPWLARISEDEARAELSESKSRLEAITGEPVRWLCYPSGSFNRTVAGAAEELGYAGACSVIRDNRASPAMLYYLPRVMVMHDTTPARFRYYFSGLYHWLHARKNRERWGEYL